MDKEQFRRLAAYGVEEHCEQSQVLYSSGDSTYDLIVLQTATVDVVRDVPGVEPERLMYRRGPGEFLGELNLLTGQHVYVTARVVEAGKVVRITPAKLRRVLAEQSDLADILLTAFQERREILREAAGSSLEIISRPDAGETLRLRSYVTRLLLPHSWFDATSASGIALMESAGIGPEDLPVALIDGQVLRGVTPGMIGEALGLAWQADGADPDLVVVGAGPAGLAAAVYGASEGLSTVLLDGTGLGGQAATSARIENYLGFPEGISGENLTRLAMVQALKFGVRISTPCEVVGIDLSDEQKPTVLLEDGTRIATRAVIAATGARYRRPGIDRWSQFEEAGCIRYAATELDVRGYEGTPVAVVGGANSAGQAALFLAARSCSVELIVRADDLEAKMSAYLAEQIRVNPAIRVRTGSAIAELAGEETLASVVVVDREGQPVRLDCRGLFCFIGAEPASSWLDAVAKDKAGFVLTTGLLPAAGLPFQTSAERVFAVGDLRAGSTKRVATAVGEWAGAVSSVHTVLAAGHP